MVSVLCHNHLYAIMISSEMPTEVGAAGNIEEANFKIRVVYHYYG